MGSSPSHVCVIGCLSFRIRERSCPRWFGCSGPPPGRRVFVGYALTAEEHAQHGTRGLLRWACLQTLAFGSDGRVYVEEPAIDAAGRKVFRGYALTDEEAGRAFEEFHRMAFNLTVAARLRQGAHPLVEEEFRGSPGPQPGATFAVIVPLPR